MSGTQIIFIGLIAITTLGAFVESSVGAQSRRTLGRVMLALAYPSILIALVAKWPWPWGIALASFPTALPPWLLAIGLITAVILGATLMTGVSPAMFVFSVVIWVDAALTGETQKWLREHLTRKK